MNAQRRSPTVRQSRWKQSLKDALGSVSAAREVRRITPSATTTIGSYSPMMSPQYRHLICSIR